MVNKPIDFAALLPFLEEAQVAKLNALPELYHHWNEQINVISRKDTDNISERHTLHSLSIIKFVQFKPGAKVLDLGTGGGFPGVPLAICFPETHFTLIDARNKKLMVIKDICEKLDIKNVTTIHTRVEDHRGKYDFVVTRAVAQLTKLFHWTRRLFSDKEQHAIPNGLIALKGGDLRAEIKPLKKASYIEKVPLGTLWGQNYFPEKYLVYLQA